MRATDYPRMKYNYATFYLSYSGRWLSNTSHWPNDIRSPAIGDKFPLFLSWMRVIMIQKGLLVVLLPDQRWYHSATQSLGYLMTYQHVLLSSTHVLLSSTITKSMKKGVLWETFNSDIIQGIYIQYTKLVEVMLDVERKLRFLPRTLMKNSLISFLKVQKKIMATKDITAIKMELRIVRETSFPEPSAVSLLAIDNLSGVTAVVFIWMDSWIG